MKILQVISTMEPGGAQRLVNDFIPLMQSKGYTTDLLVFDSKKSFLTNQLKNNGYNVQFLGFKNLYNPLIIFKLIPILKKYDVIHAHTIQAQLFCAISSLFANLKLLTTEHSTHNRRRKYKFFKYFERFIYSRYNKIICISDATRISLSTWLDNKKLANRLIVIENGIILSNFRNNLKIIPIPNKNEILITMISRFVQSKDHATVIKAIPYLNNKCIKIVFVGDGPLLEEHKLLAKDLNVFDRCLFLGYRNDVANIINNSYIGIQSSNWEGFGLTAVEFMAAGCPIIASNVEGLKQVVEGAGILFNKGDEKDLANKINRLLNDGKLYNKISQSCRERAISYDIVNMTSKYLDLYSK